MSGHIVFQPEPKPVMVKTGHQCALPPCKHPRGTVWECHGCKQRWVADLWTRHYYDLDLGWRKVSMPLRWHLWRLRGGGAR